MSTSEILLDLLIVLIAAKAAAEISERIGIPAVVGEILAGIVVGPSLLGFVGRDGEVLHLLGEIGVILLLLDVGLEMDVGELRKVGKASLVVAVLGVVVPMATGYGAMIAMGETGNTALFIGAALTATSVGITARVFGDLRALATTEARIVLGAAVADDVMGLIVLTVVVRIVTEGSVSVLSLAEIIGVAVVFLVVGAFLGLRYAPPLFRAIDRAGRGAGTLVALAFAFTLVFSELAVQAKLAPIIGAFVAGLALGRTDQSERIRSDLAPIGHILIPVFFLQIGVNAEVSAFGQGEVLRDAGILLIIAIIGKVVAAAGMGRSPGDKLLVGFGMIPRGEVGLIFATIGLQNGVLGEELYAALLLVVLATTLITPPLLKQRTAVVVAALREAVRSSGGGATVAPVPVLVDGEVRLPGHVDDADGLELALRAALFARRAGASPELVAWLASLPEGEAAGWSREERELLLDVVERGTPRSWRFLESTGILERALPELDRAIHARRNDPMVLDLDAPYRFAALERLRRLDQGDPAVAQARTVEHPQRLLIAALLVDALDGEADPVASARSFVRRLGLDPADVEAVVALVEDRHLLWAAARRAGALTEERIRQLAGHLATPERARATYVLAALRSEVHEEWEVRRLEQLHDLLQDALGRLDPDDAERDLVAARRRAVVEAVGDDQRAVARAVAAPASYLLAIAAADVARQLRLLDPVPAKRRFRITVTDLPEPGTWMVDVIGRDRAGLLAAVASVLAGDGLDVRRASFVTWADGAALESFVVAGTDAPDPDQVHAGVERAVAAATEAGPLPDLALEFDNRASPWHTVCEIDGPERPGLLAEVAAVFRAAGVAVKAATVATHEGRAYDTFELTMLDGRKLGDEAMETIRALAERGLVAPRRRFRAPVPVPAG
jgi:Kef-type K+ transport system membrane component KefB/predicted amino acid-binding ACT domain protein